MNALPADRGVTKRVLGAEGVCAHPGSVPPLCKLLPTEFSLLHFFKEIKRLDLQPPNHKKKKSQGHPASGSPHHSASSPVSASSLAGPRRHG